MHRKITLSSQKMLTGTNIKGRITGDIDPSITTIIYFSFVRVSPFLLLVSTLHHSLVKSCRNQLLQWTSHQYSQLSTKEHLINISTTLLTVKMLTIIVLIARSDS